MSPHPLKQSRRRVQRAGTSLWVVYIRRLQLKISLLICPIVESWSLIVTNLRKKEPWQEKYAAFHVVIGYRVFNDADLWPIGTNVRDW